MDKFSLGNILLISIALLVILLSAWFQNPSESVYEDSTGRKILNVKVK